MLSFLPWKKRRRRQRRRKTALENCLENVYISLLSLHLTSISPMRPSIRLLYLKNYFQRDGTGAGTSTPAPCHRSLAVAVTEETGRHSRQWQAWPSLLFQLKTNRRDYLHRQAFHPRYLLSLGGGETSDTFVARGTFLGEELISSILPFWEGRWGISRAGHGQTGSPLTPTMETSTGAFSDRRRAPFLSTGVTVLGEAGGRKVGGACRLLGGGGGGFSLLHSLLPSLSHLPFSTLPTPISHSMHFLLLGGRRKILNFGAGCRPS